MDNVSGSFSRPSKIIFAFCIVGIIFTSGFYLGATIQAKSQAIIPLKVLNQSPTLLPVYENRVVKAGINNQDSAFKPYSITIPSGWKAVRENRPINTDTLIISNNNYSLTINQASFGDGGAEGRCLYPGDPFITKAQTFTDFIQIQGLSGDFRRSWIGEGAAAPVLAYTVCHRSAYNSYESITSYGKIDVVSPNPPRAIIMKEIDEMITSITLLPFTD